MPEGLSSNETTCVWSESGLVEIQKNYYDTLEDNLGLYY